MLTDRQRELAAQLRADRAYATGRRAFPRTVTADDAVAITADLHEVLDGGAEARATAARQLGRPLACARGCTGCCEEMVMVFRPEALRVARWLERPENAAVKESFLRAYAGWKQRVGDSPERLARIFASGDEAAHVKMHIELWKKRILCAFNQDGACTIYPVRPLLCRNAHAVGTSAHCYGDDTSGVVKLRLSAPDFDSWVEDARATLRAMHHALGGPRLSPASICDAVAELLTSGS